MTVASKLKVLNLAGSKSLTKTPCFSEFMSLERLILKDFPRLAEIDHSIGKLERLIYLKIKWCPRLRGLPKEIGYLTILRELILIQCFSVRYLPDSIGNLSLLSRLVMEDIGLVGLPDTIKGLADLEHLCLANCTSLKSLPDAVGELKLLTELDLSGTTIEELPLSIWKRIDMTLRMNSSRIRTRLKRDLPLLEGTSDWWDKLGLEADLQRADLQRAQEKLKKEPKVWHQMKIIYEELEYGAKQIFLDIVCFFVNKKITSAIYMWEACGLFSKVEIDVLVNESLIKIVDGDRIRMYDHVRYFGRAIVCEENLEKPENRSRLWLQEMALDRRAIVCQENLEKPEKPSRFWLQEMALRRAQAKMGTENVVALALRRTRHGFTRENFANLKNVRFLELDEGNFVGNFEDILPELRWLYWRNCPPKLQANNFVLNHLVVLKLSGNIIIEEWSKWVKIMVPSKLKVLHLTRSNSLIKTPCFSEFMSLEKLVLKDFPQLAEIDCSIGKLEQLIYLKIKRCPLLRELPDEIGYLTALRELILIQGYSVCYLPDSIGNLQLLSRLVVKDTGLVELPDTIKRLVKLEYLCLANCTSLNSLSDAVGEIMSLTELDLSGTTIEELPHSIWNLEDLTLRIRSSKLSTLLVWAWSLLKDINDCLHPGMRQQPFGLVEDHEVDTLRLRDYPRDILFPESRTFHEHHLSVRCPPKVSVRVNFLHIRDSVIIMVAEFPLCDTEIMSSSQPILYSKKMILMLVFWLRRKWVSEWMHDFPGNNEALLTLEYCDYCMSITSESSRLSPSPPCLEISVPVPQPSIKITMTLYDWHRDQIGCRAHKLEIVTKFALPCLQFSSPLVLQWKNDWSSERLPDSIRMYNNWHEKATRLQGSTSRRSFKNGVLRGLRKARWGTFRGKRKRNLSRLCLYNYLDKRLLMYSGYFYAWWYRENRSPITEQDYCHFVLEKAFAYLHGPLDIKKKTHLIREWALVVKYMREASKVETSTVEKAYKFFEKMYIRMFY